MRKIKFRGKAESGEWLYGDLLQVANEVYIAPSDGDWFDFIPRIENNVFNLPHPKYAVIPETVGQYIGLNDKNGKEIYEEDIVKRQRIGFYDNIKYIGVVRYYETDCRFGIETSPKPYFERILFSSGEQEFNDGRCTITYTDEFEVIGNIHDNPELK